MDTASTENIVVDQGPGTSPTGALIIILFVVAIGFSWSNDLSGNCFAVAFMLALVLVGLCLKVPVRSEIDLQERVVRIYLESFSEQKKTLRYPLSEIVSVRSYYFSYRSAHLYRVLLVPIDDDKPLIRFAEFKATGPRSTRQKVEEESSRMLREDIARKCGLKDEGFVADGWRRKVE